MRAPLQAHVVLGRAAAFAVGILILVSPNAARGDVALGVFTSGLAQETGPALDRFASETGVMPKIAMYYRDWNEGWPTALIDPRTIAPILARGATPMITWEPFLSAAEGQPESAYTPARIAAGAFDPYIWRAAREAARYGRPLLVRFAHEMNGDWYPWAGRGGNSPADYIWMWRHVVSIFRGAGASNVRWVWSPNVEGSAEVQPFAAYYPGDAWVDDVALDGYNAAAVKGSPWLTFSQVFAPSYQSLTRLTGKPLFIAETACSEEGGSKAKWITAIPSALRQQMPRVRALVWFNLDKEANWTLGSSASSLQAFRAVAAAGTFAGSASPLIASSTEGVDLIAHRARARRAGRGRSRAPRR